MFNQGDIVIMNFSPQSGHEQSGRRPALVISNTAFNKRSNLTFVCPISNTDNHFPMHVALGGTQTTGFVRCEQLKSLDLKARKAIYKEHASKEVLEEVLDIIQASIE